MISGRSRAGEASSYDVVIVGAGIAGALAAWTLAQAGARVLIVEAGTDASAADRHTFVENFYTTGSPFPVNPDVPVPTFGDLGHWKEPARSRSGRAGHRRDGGYFVQLGPLPFSSLYERLVGGTTWHWQATAVRHVPNDFRTRSAYGYGIDWPIAYGDLEPWYCAAERELGVAGNAADQQYLGITISQPYPMRGIFQSYLDKRLATLIGDLTFDGQPLVVTPTPQARNSQVYDGRPACAGNTNCIPICPIQAKYDATVHLARARRLGAEVWDRTVVDRLLLDAETGLIAGVHCLRYADPTVPSATPAVVTARRYVLAANAIETAKILLNSRTDRLTGGLANASGQVGRNLMDHPIQLSWALMPESEPVFPLRGPISTSGIESLRDGPFRRQRAPFRIEISNIGWNWPTNDPYGTVNELADAGLFGRRLRAELRSRVSRQVEFGSLVEQTPEPGNRVTLSDQTDALGIPRPQIAYNLSEHTRAGFAAAREAARLLFARIGATDQTTEVAADDVQRFEWAGRAYKLYGAGHLLGTHRMGDRGTSVVDRHLRSHDHPNLFLLGGGVFPTVGTSNPTLTIAALALMAVHTIVSDLAA